MTAKRKTALRGVAKAFKQYGADAKASVAPKPKKAPTFYPRSNLVDPRAPKGEDCGCKRAGIGLFNERHEVQRCDDCNLFETDDDAANAVDHLLKLLGAEYRDGGGTVADAMDRLVDGREALLLAKGALQEGYVNCGGDDEESVYGEPMRAVNEALGRRGEG